VEQRWATWAKTVASGIIFVSTTELLVVDWTSLFPFSTGVGHWIKVLS
jgi:hypothetical protein